MFLLPFSSSLQSRQLESQKSKEGKNGDSLTPILFPSIDLSLAYIPGRKQYITSLETTEHTAVFWPPLSFLSSKAASLFCFDHTGTRCELGKLQCGTVAIRCFKRSAQTDPFVLETGCYNNA